MNKDYPGILSRTELNDYEKQLFLEFMQNSRKNVDFDILMNIFEDQFFEFLDIFAGKSIRLSKRSIYIKNIEYIKIFSYVRRKGTTKEAFIEASKKFKRKVSSIHRIYEHVNSNLKSELKDELYGGGKIDE